jgi:hypothetical protein
LIWWEDFKVGEAAVLGEHTFTEDEIVAFARHFAPPGSGFFGREP